ncbi:MAG: metal-dependent hydrolase [Pseudomonadota bacterium]
MPNGRTHKVVGAVAGGSFALVRSAGQPAVHRTVETAGGVLADVGLGMLPDVLEPAIHPGHRSVAHSAAPAVALGVLASRHLDSWQASLRARADRQGALAMQSQSTLAQLWHAFLELLLRLAAGAVAGALGGYGSHLALDAFTPRSLPLIA